MTSPAAVLEAEFQRQVVDLAQILGWQVLHVRRSVGRRGGRPGWQTTTSIDGWPDLFLWRPGRTLAAELKSDTGKATPAQLSVLDSLRAAGVETHLWRPGDLQQIADTLR